MERKSQEAKYRHLKEAAEDCNAAAVEFRDSGSGKIQTISWYPRGENDNFPIEATYLTEAGDLRSDRWFENGNYASLRNPGGFSLRLKQENRIDE